MKIMATFDGSGFSEAIVPLLLQIAGLPDANFTLIAVAELPGGRRRRGRTRRPAAVVVNAPTGGDAFVVEPSPQVFVETKDQAIARQLAELQDYLHHVALQFPEGMAYAIEAHVGHPAEVIIERARQEAPDVIVMATHGRTGIVRSVFGSVAEDVLRAGVAPVLLVHPEDVKRHRAGE